MISAEGMYLVGGDLRFLSDAKDETVPIMFSKACESRHHMLLCWMHDRSFAVSPVFIAELTCRAWLVAESHKRRTLQKSDVAAAIARSDMFDFLVDIVPRDDGDGRGAEEGKGDVPLELRGRELDLGEDDDRDETLRAIGREEKSTRKLEMGTGRRDRVEESVRGSEADGEGLFSEFVEGNG